MNSPRPFLADLLDARRAARARFDKCDTAIEGWDQVARSRRSDVPPVEATGHDRMLSSTAEITVSVEWLAYMLDFLADYSGPGGAA